MNLSLTILLEAGIITQEQADLAQKIEDCRCELIGLMEVRVAPILFSEKETFHED